MRLLLGLDLFVLVVVGVHLGVAVVVGVGRVMASSVVVHAGFDEAVNSGIRGDRGLAEQPLALLELPTPLVGLSRGLGDAEVPVPASDNVTVEVRVLQVAAFEGVDLTLEVGQRVRDLGATLDQVAQLLPRVQ